MKSYEDWKNWLKENKNYLAVGAGFVVVFIVGFGTGIYQKPTRRQNVQSNYTTSAAKKPVVNEAQAQIAGETVVNEVANPAPAKAVAPADAACLIKGNISAKGDKIYHLKGGAFYDRTKAEQCFNTEAEAQAAGFRKSSR